MKPDPLKKDLPRDWYRAKTKADKEMKRLDRIDLIVGIVLFVVIATAAILALGLIPHFLKSFINGGHFL